MIKEAYVSFEVAKLLKEKGFVESCYGRYSVRSKEFHLDTTKPCNNGSNFLYCAPTHQMALQWLREHGLHINAPISYDYSVDADGNEVDRWTFYMFEIYSSFSGNLIYTEEVNEYDSYEEAIEAALKYCLKNLI